jgi:hypothetical protein
MLLEMTMMSEKPRLLYRIGHYLMTWLVFPLSIFGFLVWSISGVLFGNFSIGALITSLLGLLGLGFASLIGYGYYVPKGLRKYFYVVFAIPLLVSFIFFIISVVLFLISNKGLIS